jgi:phosphoglycolate phosphatase-like HAD superfamily hydrolase
VTGALRAVLFDMDGPLMDSEPLWFEAERSVMARLSGPGGWLPGDRGAQRAASGRARRDGCGLAARD